MENQLTSNSPKLIFIMLALVVLLLAGCAPIMYPTPIPCGDVDMLITAIEIANADPATSDTIELDAGCVYELAEPYDHGNLAGSTGLPQITSPIKILGQGAAIIRSLADGTPKFRLFLVSNNGDLFLEDLSLQNGYADDPNFPNDVQRNSGGTIRNTNILKLKEVHIQNGNANGVTGGIFNEDTLEMKTSSISGCEQDANTWTMGGATAIHNYFNGPSAVIVQSAIYGNGLNGTWMAITNSETGFMRLENTTISGNSGYGLNNDGDMEVIFCTIVGNSLGIWSVNYGIPNVDLRGTLFQNTTDCNIGSGVLTTNIHNMDSDGSCATTYTIPAAGQGLLPLAHNGSSTMTHALGPSSPAIDAVMGTSQRECPVDKDQRGVSRPQLNRCDIGAFEFEGQTSQSLSQDTPTPEAPTDTPEPETPTSTPKPDRCDLFDSENARVIMHDIPYGSTTLELFVEWPHAVWGLEKPLEGDDRPWDYMATLGKTPAEMCSYRGYSGRLYCTFILTKNHFGNAYPLNIYLHPCVPPIYTHPAVSIFEPDKPEKVVNPTKSAPTCKSTLGAEECKLAGGDYDKGTKSCFCPKP